MRKRKKRLAAFQKRWRRENTIRAHDPAGHGCGGKDGVIRHVMGGINPQGARVSGFKQPTPVERDHGYLWRVSRATPLLGEIGIFNRSHYEDVLVARVHKENLDRRGLAGDPDDPSFWDDRLRDIRHFETYLHRQNVHIVKIMLHISPEEQRRRLLRRLESRRNSGNSQRAISRSVVTGTPIRTLMRLPLRVRHSAGTLVCGAV